MAYSQTSIGLGMKLDEHRGCRLRVERIFNDVEPAIGLVCITHRDETVLRFGIPECRKIATLEVDLHAWWTEQIPDDDELARGIWEALPAEWTDAIIGDEFWISDIRARC